MPRWRKACEVSRRPRGGALQIATLDQIGLDDVLDRVARLGQCGGHRLDADRAAAIVLRDGGEVAAVHRIEAGGVDLERAQRVVGNLAIDPVGIGRRGKIAHAAQQPAGDTWRAARASRDLVGAIRAHADVEHAGATGDDALKLFDRVEIQPDRNAEAVTQGIGEQAGARGGADESEFRQLDLDRARRRALADDEVELEILHRGIEHLFHRRAEAMDLVDEQHIALFEIGEECREIAGLGDHRA
ncbi:hypothetical protein ACVIN2_003257 [Bradyrhizobium sp. USDA 3650]